MFPFECRPQVDSALAYVGLTVETIPHAVIAVGLFSMALVLGLGLFE